MPIRSVLIVEDEENVVELLRINMVRRGFEVIVATNGEEGLSLAISRHPDIMLLDIRLPGMDGWEVCRQLKSNPQTCSMHIIILSAAAQKKDIDRSHTCGASAFIVKPFDIPKLLRTIAELS